MAPPLFADLGKATRDVFEKGHILDLFKLTAKGKTCGAMTMKTNATHSFADGSFSADVEGTYPVSKHGLTFTPKWDTNNVFGLAVELANKILPGLSLKAEGSFSPDSGEKTGSYKVTYKNELVHAQAGLKAGGESSMTTDASVVVGYQGWLAGGKGEVDLSSGSISDYVVTFGHSYGNLQAFISAKNLQQITCDIYQRVSDRCEMGLSFGVRETENFYNLGCRYLFDEGNYIRAKINNESKIGLGYESVLGGCVRFTVSTELDAKNLTGGQKFGIGLDL